MPRGAACGRNGASPNSWVRSLGRRPPRRQVRWLKRRRAPRTSGSNERRARAPCRTARNSRARSRGGARSRSRRPRRIRGGGRGWGKRDAGCGRGGGARDQMARLPPPASRPIGRGAGRGRVEDSGGGGSIKKKKKDNMVNCMLLNLLFLVDHSIIVWIPSSSINDKTLSLTPDCSAGAVIALDAQNHAATALQ